MFNFLKSRTPPSRQSLLTAIPTKNNLIQESAPTPATLRLTAPLRSHKLKFLTPAAKQKSFDLDDLGAFVWRSINNHRTVEQLITHFADHHRLNLREAEIAVLAFLKTLTQRNLIALATK